MHKGNWQSEGDEEVEGYEVFETRDLGAQKKEEIKRIMGYTSSESTG